MSLVASALLLLLSALLRPQHAACAPGWWLPLGVRRSGLYVCTPLPAPRWVRGPHGGWTDASSNADGAIVGEVYCAAGQRAVTSDGRSVGCR